MLLILSSTVLSCGSILTGCVHSFVFLLLKEGSIVMFGGVFWLVSRSPIGVEVLYWVVGALLRFLVSGSSAWSSSGACPLSCVVGLVLFEMTSKQGSNDNLAGFRLGTVFT